MELIQFSTEQLKSLMQQVSEAHSYKFVEGAIPPEHVIKRAIFNLENGVSVLWAFPYFMCSNGKIIGSCGFKNAPHNGYVEIGYNVASSARGKGIASLAVKQLCGKAFQSKEVSAVKALILSDNLASLKVVRKNGFAYVGEVVDADNEQLECWQLKA